MKLSYFLFPFLFITYLVHAQKNDNHKFAVGNVIDLLHDAAAKADFDGYFNLMTENAVFIGTDASENWTKKEFQAYAKPHFEKGKAWSFKSIQRNIYFSSDHKTAWFDELLDTQMKICRGSGVLIKVKNNWKIIHYVLSISVPNELSKEVIKLKTDSDNLLLQKLKP